MANNATHIWKYCAASEISETTWNLAENWLDADGLAVDDYPTGNLPNDSILLYGAVCGSFALDFSSADAGTTVGSIVTDATYAAGATVGGANVTVGTLTLAGESQYADGGAGTSIVNLNGASCEYDGGTAVKVYCNGLGSYLYGGTVTGEAHLVGNSTSIQTAAVTCSPGCIVYMLGTGCYIGAGDFTGATIRVYKSGNPIISDSMGACNLSGAKIELYASAAIGDSNATLTVDGSTLVKIMRREVICTPNTAVYSTIPVTAAYASGFNAPRIG